MIRLFCDRCGAEVISQDAVIINFAPNAPTGEAGHALCNKCKTAYDKFIVNSEDVVATGKATIEVKPPK